LATPEEARASPQQARVNRKRIKELERELLRKDRALSETAALLVLSNSLGDLPQGRGRMIRLEDRHTMVQAIAIARRRSTTESDELASQACGSQFDRRQHQARFVAFTISRGHSERQACEADRHGISRSMSSYRGLRAERDAPAIAAMKRLAQ